MLSIFSFFRITDINIEEILIDSLCEIIRIYIHIRTKLRQVQKCQSIVCRRHFFTFSKRRFIVKADLGDFISSITSESPIH